MKKAIDATTRTITFTFEGLDPIVFSAEKMSAANTDYAVLHGMAARIGDTAALSKSAENNFTVTEAMRRAEVEAMVRFYENPDNKDWTLRSPAAPRVVFNPLIQRAAEKMGKTYEEAAAWYNAKLMAEIDAM